MQQVENNKQSINQRHAKQQRNSKKQHVIDKVEGMPKTKKRTKNVTEKAKSQIPQGPPQQIISNDRQASRQARSKSNSKGATRKNNFLQQCPVTRKRQKNINVLDGGPVAGIPTSGTAEGA